MWTDHSDIDSGSDFPRLNSTAKSGTPKRTNNAMHRLISQFDTCSLSLVSLCELSTYPSQSPLSKVFNLKGLTDCNVSVSLNHHESDSSLKMPDLPSFVDINRSKMESLNQSDSLPVFPSGISKEEEVAFNCSMLKTSSSH